MIQVISAVVMLRSLPINDDVTETEPASSALMAIAIVAVKTNITSWRVDLKHAGRALLVWTGDNVSMPVSASIGDGVESPLFSNCFSSSMAAMMELLLARNVTGITIGLHVCVWLTAEAQETLPTGLDVRSRS